MIDDIKTNRLMLNFKIDHLQGAINPLRIPSLTPYGNTSGEIIEWLF